MGRVSAWWAEQQEQSPPEPSEGDYPIMDVRCFHERTGEIRDMLRLNGFPQASVTTYGDPDHCGPSIHVRLHGWSKPDFESFRHVDPEQTISDALAYAYRAIQKAGQNDLEVAATLGITPDGRVIPDFAEAAE